MKRTAETQRTQSYAEGDKGGSIKSHVSLRSLCDLRAFAVRIFYSAQKRIEGILNESTSNC